MKALAENSLYPANVLDAKIVAFNKRGNSLQTEAHKLACSVLLQLGKSHDVTIVLKFVSAMPEMVRANGLRNWFEQFGPVKFIQMGEGKDATETVVHVKDKPVKLGEGMKKPFYKFSAKEGVPYEALDVAKATEQFIKRLEKDGTETGADHTLLIKALRRAGVTPTPAATKPSTVRKPAVAAAPAH